MQLACSNYEVIEVCKILFLQDRLPMSLEQDLIRQYQRHCGQGNPPNACDALVERMLPYWYTSGRSHDPSSRSHGPIMNEDIDTVVKETWKKFYNLKVLSY